MNQDECNLSTSSLNSNLIKLDISSLEWLEPCYSDVIFFITVNMCATTPPTFIGKL